MKIKSINPFTEEVNQEFTLIGMDECRSAIARAKEAFADWKNVPVGERSHYLQEIGTILKENKKHYAEIITREMGKPIRQSVAEIEKCAVLCDYYSNHSASFLQDEVIPTEAYKSCVTFEPLGVILGVMPWNFPFWQVFRFAVPTLAAGNVCLLKHASNVPMTALALEDLFTQAGMPSAVFQTLLIDGGTTGQLVESDLVQGVSLTGSVEAGTTIGSLAGGHLKKLVLELGGSDPFIVLDDADIEAAAETGLTARTINNGQSCIAAKRFIVMESVAARFKDEFLKYFMMLKVGDPLLESTDIGPMAKPEIVRDLVRQLEDAREKGAEVVYGPAPPRGKGYFFQPAMVFNVTAGMKIVQEEVFGPIAPILIAGNEEEAVRLANATPFGLGASLWSRDKKRAERLSRDIEVGFVAINDMVKSDPRLPFGGVKHSGIGRELSHYGLKEFVNAKTVVIK